MNRYHGEVNMDGRRWDTLHENRACVEEEEEEEEGLSAFK